MEARGNIGGVPGGLWGPGGLVTSDTGLHPHWARITGNAAGTNRYAHEQVDEGDYPAFAGTLAAAFGVAGTSAVEGGPAYELSGRQDVPTGAFVKLWPSGDLTYWTFRYEVTAAAATTFANDDRTPSFTVSADDTWTFAGNSPASDMALPSGGKYLLFLRTLCTASASAVGSTQGRVEARFYNDTAGTELLTYRDSATESATIFGNWVINTVSGTTLAERLSFGASCVINPAGAITVKLQLRRVSAAGLTWSSVTANTVIGYVKFG